MMTESINREKINLTTLTAQEKIQLTKDLYSKKSYFQQKFNFDKKEFDCHVLSQSLRKEIERLLLEKKIIRNRIQLENMHEVLSDEMKAYNFDDGVNKITTYFYDTDSSFLNAYYQLVQYIREKIIQEPFWFQATPTIRIHCPNGKNSNHYPRYHTDVGYGHPPEEINFWLPLTETLEGHGFRTMDFLNSKQIMQELEYDFNTLINKAINDKSFSAYCDTLSQAVDTPFGKIAAFDSRCIHTGEPLKAHTRISIDIRVLPLSEYKSMKIEYQGSGRRKILFTPGHCYHQQDSDTFLQNKGIEI